MKIIQWVSFGLLIIVCLVIGYWALTPMTSPGWSGFGPYNEQVQGPRAKTLWDWLELIIIPLVLALGAWLLSSADKDADRNKEVDRQRQNTLNSFFEKISTLLLDKELRISSTRDEIKGIARSYALSAFRLLDPRRKAEALQFLYETRLVSKRPIINLNGANLRNIWLKNAPLVNAEIKGAHFERACLIDANLTNANFCGSNFSYADFRGAILDNTDLSFANLDGANFINCDMTKVELRGAILKGAKLKGIKILPKQLKVIASLEKTEYSKEDAR